jgi:DNA-directed RNA polymerase subunit RPC12/RpoP
VIGQILDGLELAGCAILCPFPRVEALVWVLTSVGQAEEQARLFPVYVVCGRVRIMPTYECPNCQKDVTEMKVYRREPHAIKCPHCGWTFDPNDPRKEKKG